MIAERVPAISTISNYAKKLNQYELVRLREGTYEADLQFQPKGKIVPDFPHSRWEIDHTLLPIKVAFRFTDYHGVEQTVIVGKGARQSSTPLSAILRLAREAGALYSEMSALDLVGPCESLVLARGGRRERKARLSIEGCRVVEEYRQIRESIVAAPDAALFTVAREPWTRLDGKTIATMVRKAISEAGLSSSELKAAMIHRSVSGAIIDQGLGWDVAATSAAYCKIPNVRRQKTDLETMKRLIDAFDRFLLPD